MDLLWLPNFSGEAFSGGDKLYFSGIPWETNFTLVGDKLCGKTQNFVEKHMLIGEAFNGETNFVEHKLCGEAHAHEKHMLMRSTCS